MAQPAIQYAATRSGTRIAYTIRGAGIRVVVPPGTVTTQLPPRPLPPDRDPKLLAERTQLLHYDRAGTGLSQRAPYDFSLDSSVEELRAVVDDAGLSRFVLLGHSYAGPTTIKYSIEYPERVQHLVLRDTRAASEKVAQNRLMLLREALKKGDWRATSQAYALLWGAGREATVIAEYLRAAVEPSVLLDFFEGVSSHDVRDLLGDVVVPTTIVRRPDLGPVSMDSDALASADELAQLIPGATLRTLEGRHWDWRNFSFLDDELAADETPAAAIADAESADIIPLSPRELEVIRLLAAGASNRRIADRLTIAESTVANHVRNILTKTTSSNRAEAAAWAAQRGLLAP